MVNNLSVLSKYEKDGETVVWKGSSDELIIFNSALLQYKYDILWQAANNYQESFISGAAIGMVTIGVLQSKPKCMAVLNWIQNIWDIYYLRKAEITVETEPDLDFTMCGLIPHTVPEIKEEVFA